MKKEIIKEVMEVCQVVMMEKIRGEKDGDFIRGRGKDEGMDKMLRKIDNQLDYFMEQRKIYVE